MHCQVLWQKSKSKRSVNQKIKIQSKITKSCYMQFFSSEAFYIFTKYRLWNKKVFTFLAHKLFLWLLSDLLHNTIPSGWKIFFLNNKCKGWSILDHFFYYTTNWTKHVLISNKATNDFESIDLAWLIDKNVIWD